MGYSSDGSLQVKCSKCGETDTQVIPHIDHCELTTVAYTYTGAGITPEVIVVDREGNPVSSEYYDVIVSDAVIGEVTATVSFKGYYKGGQVLNFQILPRAVSTVTTANLSSGIQVKWNKVTEATGYKIYRSTNSGAYKKVKTMTSGTTVSWKDTTAKTNGCRYRYKVYAYTTSSDKTYTGAASKVKTTYFVSQPTISSVKAATKAFTVTWKKNAKATGYQIQYSTKRDFSSGNKTATVKGAANVSKKIRSLTAKKKYYVRIRTYKTVSGTKYYSTWSAKMSVTTK